MKAKYKENIKAVSVVVIGVLVAFALNTAFSISSQVAKLKNKVAG